MSEEPQKGLDYWPGDRRVATGILSQNCSLLDLVVGYGQRADWSLEALKKFLSQDFLRGIARVLEGHFKLVVEGVTVYSQTTQYDGEYLIAPAWYNDKSELDEYDKIVEESGSLKITSAGDEDANLAGYFAYEEDPPREWGQRFQIANTYSGVFVTIWNITSMLALPESLTKKVKKTAGVKFNQTSMILAQPIHVYSQFAPYVCQIILSKPWESRKSSQNNFAELMQDIFSWFHVLYSLASDNPDPLTISFLNYVTKKTNNQRQEYERELTQMVATLSSRHDALKRATSVFLEDICKRLHTSVGDFKEKITTF